MIWTFMALLAGSHVDLVNNPDQLRICAVGAMLSAEKQAARGDDEINIAAAHAIADMFTDRLKAIGAEDAAALAATKKSVTGTPDQLVVLDRCSTIVGALRGSDTLLEGAARADAAPDAGP